MIDSLPQGNQTGDPSASDNARVKSIRSQFPALTMPTENQNSLVFLDGPGGTQVPRSVVDAMAKYLFQANANVGGGFLTSKRTDETIDSGLAAATDLFGTEDPGEVVVGNNMTSLAFHLADALAPTWSSDDTIIVTRLDHDANIRPWVRAAELAGATVRWVEVDASDCTLNLSSLEEICNGPGKIRFAAVGAASNAVGTKNPIHKITQIVHEVGGIVFVDGVHSTPHELPDVNALECDFYACSPYKFYGPHSGLLWGRRELWEQLDAPKVRPATESLPGRWMTGTANHEAIAGIASAIEYLASVDEFDNGEASKALQPTVTGNTESTVSRRDRLSRSFRWIRYYEHTLLHRLLNGLKTIEGINVRGITDPAKFMERCPTLGVTHDSVSSHQLAESLGQQGICCWAGHYYAIELIETLGMYPDGMLRLGLMHYNTADEVDRTVESIRQIVANKDTST